MNRSYPALFRRFVAAGALGLFLSAPDPAWGLDTIEEIIERSESGGSIGQLLLELQELGRKKTDLDKATSEELLRLPFLNPVDVGRIISWRTDKGTITSEDELAMAIGRDKAAQAAPYLRFGTKEGERAFPPALPLLQGSLAGRVYWETPPRKGIETGRYEGGNSRVYSRLQADSPHAGVILVQEKDIGEPDFADFTSLSIHVDDVGILKKGVAGKYDISFGQGLLFGQSRYFTKGSAAVEGVLLSSGPLKPYASSSEGGFLQGAAATVGVGALDITPFYSRNGLDATISNGVVTGVSATGYHRTAYEQGKKNNLTEEVGGLNMKYLYHSSVLQASFGGTVMRSSYSLPLVSGNGMNAASLDATVVCNDVVLFGEAARAIEPEALSWTCGVQAALTPDVTAITALRQYGREYSSPFAGAFAERGTDGSNEEGYYTGINAKIMNTLQVGASFDMFRFPELSSSYRLPSSGYDGRLYATWRQNPSMTWSSLYQHKEKEETKTQTGSEGRDYVMAVPVTTDRVQLGLETKLSPAVILKTKAEGKRLGKMYAAGKESEQGWMFYGQMNYARGGFSVRTRYTRFETDSYDAAIYVYEDDLPLVYNLGILSGKGQAMFLVVTHEPVKNFRLAAKYDITWYSDRTTYGSDNDLRNTSSPGAFHLGCYLQF